MSTEAKKAGKGKVFLRHDNPARTHDLPASDPRRRRNAARRAAGERQFFDHDLGPREMRWDPTRKRVVRGYSKSDEEQAA